MAETFQIPYYMRHSINVKFSQRTAEWRIEGKTAMGKGDIMSCETYGTSRANAYKILEETLNLKDVRIYDTIEDDDGKPKRVLNKRETMLAQQKQQSIKDAFANWIWQDPQRGAFRWCGSITSCLTAPDPANTTANTFISSE